MSKHLKAIFVLVTFFSFSDLVLSQENKTTFGGSADAYYKFDFAKQNTGRTSFTNSHNSFELGMFSLSATHAFGKASALADIGFGKRAKDFSYNDQAETFFIKQLNFNYEIVKNFKVTLGSFATHIGYELVDAYQNKNYSMSYAFTNGPFFNTGLKANYVADKFNFMLGVTNPTDFKTALQSGSDNKTVIGQIGYTADKFSGFLNFTTGSRNPLPLYTPNQIGGELYNRTQFDFVGSYKATEKLGIAFNATYAIQKHDEVSDLDTNWLSIIGYLSYQTTEKSALNWRAEYVKDDKALFGDEVSVFANTLSWMYSVDNLKIGPEVRFDSASKDIFVNSKSEPTKTSASVLLSTTYVF